MAEYPLTRPEGPEETRRREDMRIRDVRYGFFRVATEPIPTKKCDWCDKEIIGASFSLNGVPYHFDCYFKEKMNAGNQITS